MHSPPLPSVPSPSVSLTLGEIASLTQATLEGESEYRITGVADLHVAGPCDIGFYADPRYKEAARTTQAGALFMRPDAGFTHSKHTLLTENPKAAFALLCQLLHSNQAPFQKTPSIHQTAVIAPSAQIDSSVVIGPHVVIEEEVIIGARCQIGAGCYLGHQVRLGEECHLFPRVTVLERSLLGNRVVLQSGVVIGSLGFGYQTAADGTHTFIPHLGSVIIEDDVEIGAGSTVDRGQLGATVIGKGTKIDNQVQIAHNATIGPNNLFAAQVGFAGSSRTGKNVILAGKVGVNDHVELGDQVIVTAFSAVSKNLLKPGPYGGIPAEPYAPYKRNLVLCRKMQTYVQQLSEIAERLRVLEKLLTP